MSENGRPGDLRMRPRTASSKATQAVGSVPLGALRAASRCSLARRLDGAQPLSARAHRLRKEQQRQWLMATVTETAPPRTHRMNFLLTTFFHKLTEPVLLLASRGLVLDNARTAQELEHITMLLTRASSMDWVHASMLPGIAVHVPWPAGLARSPRPDTRLGRRRPDSCRGSARVDGAGHPSLRRRCRSSVDLMTTVPTKSCRK